MSSSRPSPPASGFVPASAFGAVSSTSTATLSSSRRLTVTKCTGNGEMIAEIGGQPPLASTEDNEATDGTKTEEISDEDEAILGLDDAPSSKDSDEQQK